MRVKLKSIGWLGLLCAVAASGTALAGAQSSEQDYFSELPEVLTVTRLAQPLSDTPGAVTIIDRETIRRSGARELTDVLRLVPGYMVGGYNGANPTATYHAPIDTSGVRNLVLIDGRPVYSTFYQGDTHRGMMGVLLEDIERIEVLRGSNSAAYGANAMFGVINVITRHTADTLGGEVSVTGGEGGIYDNMARIGWGNDAASFRLSTARRSDSGYGNAYDDKIVSQLHFRGDLRLATEQDLLLEAGITQISAGDGLPNKVGNPERTIGWDDFYLHGQWRRQLSATDEIKLTANFEEETLHDAYIYALDPSVIVSTNGRSRRVNLELQHQLGISDSLRAVWGLGYKYEDVASPALYATENVLSLHEERLFGNLEWRLHPQWLINAGGFWGNNSRVGSYFAPRLMANFLVTPDHTLRAGVTESSRMPTMFELAGDIRFYPKNALHLPLLTNVTTLLAAFNQPYRFYMASGDIGQEKLKVQEVGYFGNFRDLRLTLDVRGYIEKMSDLMDEAALTIPGYALPILGTPIPVLTYDNTPGFKVHGIEYQLRWKPLEKTEIWVNQSFERLIWDSNSMRPNSNQPPTRATTIALFQKLPFDLDLGLTYHKSTAMSWGGANDGLPSRRRVDARLAMPFRVGSTKAEAAFTVQAENGSYPEYLSSYKLVVERRAFGTLRFEF